MVAKRGVMDARGSSTAMFVSAVSLGCMSLVIGLVLYGIVGGAFR